MASFQSSSESSCEPKGYKRVALEEIDEGKSDLGIDKEELQKIQ